MELLVVGVFAVLVLLMLMGMPLGLALAAAGAIGLVALDGNLNLLVQFVGSTPLDKASGMVFATIPAFVLMAYLMAESGLAEDAYRAGATWLSRVRGGLGMASTLACAAFGAMSGASTSAAAVMSRISYPGMSGRGYAASLSTGVVSVGSTLVTLIPPSIAMVLYSTTTGESIGAVFMAGIFPGAILLLLIVVTIATWVKLRPQHASDTTSFSLRESLRSLKPIWLSLAVIAIIFGSLYSGFATATEVGALGAVLIGAVGVARRRVGLSGIIRALQQTLRTTSLIFLIIAGAAILSYFTVYTRVPQTILEMVRDAGLNRWVVIALVCVVYFVLSMFIDEAAVLLITLPIVFPIITTLGFDPVWFGIVMVLLIAMGLVFPPVGLIALIVSAETKVPVPAVYRGAIVLTLPLLVTLIAVLAFPEIATWLPATMR